MEKIVNTTRNKASARNKTLRKSVNPRLYNVTINLLLIVVTLFSLYNIGRSIDQTSDKLAVYDQARKEVDELSLKNLQLILKSEEVTSDDYIETQARDRLRYSKESEIAFIIPKEVLNDPSLDSYIDAVMEKESIAAIDNRSNPEIWLDFLIKGKL